MTLFPLRLHGALPFPTQSASAPNPISDAPSIPAERSGSHIKWVRLLDLTEQSRPIAEGFAFTSFARRLGAPLP